MTNCPRRLIDTMWNTLRIRLFSNNDQTKIAQKIGRVFLCNFNNFGCGLLNKIKLFDVEEEKVVKIVQYPDKCVIC